MAFTTAARDAITEKLRIKAGIADGDTRFLVPAISVVDSGSENGTSSTVEVMSSSVTLVGDTSGTDLVTFAISTTLTSAAAALTSASTGVTATLIAPDGDAPSTDLALVGPVSILNSPVVLYANDTTLLEQLVDEALARAEAHCRTRLFDDGSDIDETLWRDHGAVNLDDAPVNRLNFFAVDTERALSVQYSGTGRGTVEVINGTLILRTHPDSSAITETEVDISDASTNVSDIISTITGVTGWSASTVNDGPAHNLVDSPPQEAASELRLDAWLPADGLYRLDRRAGVIHLDDLMLDGFNANVRASGQCRIRYEAGYTTLPADLEGLIINAAKAGLDATSRTDGVSSEQLGDYSYSAPVSLTRATAAIDESLAAQSVVLNRYRRWSP